MYEILINTYAILTTKHLDKKWETVKKNHIILIFYPRLFKHFDLTI